LICPRFKAGKHVYCEKPLTHSVAEARELRELSRTSNVVTQMGNQGSASESLRRCTEIIRAGKSLEWDGEKMEAKNGPEAARFVHTEYRTKWLT